MFEFNPFRSHDLWLEAVNEAAIDEAIALKRKFILILFRKDGLIVKLLP